MAPTRLRAPRLVGSMTALVTPFKDDAVDEKAFQRLCGWQIEQGTRALIAVGTTGESPTLSHAEHRRVIDLAVEVGKGRAVVVAGAGSNSTEEAIGFMRHAEKAGADAALVVTPYYNKPTQEGLYRHFKALHDCCGLPIVIYNIPPRSVIDMSVATMARLAELPRIIGVKDATNDLARPQKILQAIGADFVQLSGEDATALAFVAQGGHGCISVTANVAPRALADMHEAWAEGDVARAQAINARLYPLHEALFLESNPSPVKYAASLLGLAAATTRLPLCEISDETKRRVRLAMEHAGLLETVAAR
jgi:4-hydroxy-tetrahydrodipicolinate synthase